MEDFLTICKNIFCKIRETNIFKITIISIIAISFFLPSAINAYHTISIPVEANLSNDTIDIDYVYNITKRLSNIIFTEYDEENGEIAKGRFFGSKGENRAAEILAENFTNLGLDVTLEKIEDRPGYEDDPNAHNLEVVDFKVLLDNRAVDCYVAPSWADSNGDVKNLDTTFNLSGLKIIPMPRYPCLFDLKIFREKQDFVFITNDQWNQPGYSLPLIELLRPFLHPIKLYMIFHVKSLLNIQRWTAFWSIFYAHCKGLIMYDFNKDCHDMIYFHGITKNFLPVIFMNGTDGNYILNNLESSRLYLYLDQRYNKSVVSYNVVGTLEGEDPSKIFVLCGLYDSWWCQGTADSAIGVGIVMGVAKYYAERNIKPKYTMKFILFSGEELNIRGAYYYEAIHKDENIEYIIDLNQVGFTQSEPRQTLDIVGNKKGFLDEVWSIVKRTDYVNRTGDSADIEKMFWSDGRMPSNPKPFAVNRVNCKALAFFKDGGWMLHHRDGLNHTEGDVLKYFNWTDVLVTGEIVLNITKHFTIDTNNEKIKNNDITLTDVEAVDIRKI